MRVKESQVEIEDIGGGNRSPGLHLSDVLKPLLQSVDEKRFSSGGIDPVRFHLGFIWEEVLSQAFARTMEGRESQLEVESEMCGRRMYFTLDAVDTEKWRVHEYKATWMSARHPIEDHRFWHYFVQMKAYCKVVESREAELWVLFINGDYSREKGMGGPQMKRWEVEFSESEIEENWLMLENKMKQLIREGVIQ